MTALPFQGVDDDVLAHCVSCGLCLSHCPTFRVTGLDSHSPRGRIALVDAVRNGQLELDSGVRDALDSCVQCMGCIPACPSGVRYDEIIHPVIEELTRSVRVRRFARRAMFLPLGRPRLLSCLTTVAGIAQRLRLLPRRISAPNLKGRRRASIDPQGRPVNGSVDLLTGCITGEWFGDVHAASINVLVAMGYEVRPTARGLCCGALHSHSGLPRRASQLLGRVRRRATADSMLITNSAGCGAHLSMNGVDTCEIMDFIATNIDRLPEHTVTTPREKVVVHDACHLRNVMAVHASTHAVLSRWYDVVTIPDEGLCCGAGGAYSLVRPDDATRIVERKFDALRMIDLDGVRFLSSGNPGCTGHLAAHLPSDLSSLQLVHPVELVARMLETEAGTSGMIDE